ncbi:acyl-CoA dehydrogenase, short-chain specific [Clostridium pasteurianum DSM 525 = ATCC 6013]|uniref:Acyl-CoA dehydrogenase, short-chain specific n=1 Tax=Clostridium pasteurianum DSM 525 = ATCC 6013 TaxID=1262449 RepID=A0A0H3J851_CLOPA|nr:acyl-CoA dehydrogenase family protein [Clostridium pasteurianum]AJA47200.1 acyl-CoA dehydrogenase, short-chain specific [Clostridium pasteurianum DSM 525 = ATCC 6013]AJA51188.1 acyl-CoA dehydrogenase, short-chain specific [Clostridium pasteurianum DSM 525 = ATCC 6013]AOZ74554.1 acyl-CoA dehydrogenase [Clostridium pasteurianum DSM 525 = ATCC 6013]AOZ78351.1 acyl-CoA dehydrogenase [Clostridium pasteurianum]ELP59415.1 acyl-CoA dehydrogenase [Clostridium pasteurianum DSM 525 = ATCC 6013]
MNFDLTEQQQLIQKTARDFAENELKPRVIENDENSKFQVDTYKKMGELGLIGMPYPKEYGGFGGDYLSYVLAVEEISKIDGSVGISYSVSTSLCSGGIFNNASEEQKKKYLPDVLSGKKFGSFGLTEPNAGSDASGVQTTAVKQGDYYILNGSKCFITNGPLSETFFVIASTDRSKGAKGLSAFIVEKDFSGFSIGKIENKCGIRAAQVSELVFEDCKVPVENLVGQEGKGLGMALSTLDGGRIGVAAQGLGIAEGAFNVAKKYMTERVQFGKPLFKNQYLAFKMAELELEIEQAKYILYKAALDKQNKRPYGLSAAKAKLACTDAAMHVTVEAVQMLGGNGYMREYNVERMMRDAKITQIYEGTNEIQKLIISGAIFR